MNQPSIIPFEPSLSGYFKDLNLDWIRRYFVVEPMDEKMLGDPQAYFIDTGGKIFFAKVDDKIAGTFALLKYDDGVCELSKMAVDTRFQGMNIGNLMMGFCIAEARSMGVKKLVLYSNTQLTPAIHLYRKYGFAEVLMGNTDYKRSNIKMELVLR